MALGKAVLQAKKVVPEDASVAGPACLPRAWRAGQEHLLMVWCGALPWFLLPLSTSCPWEESHQLLPFSGVGFETAEAANCQLVRSVAGEEGTPR